MSLRFVMGALSLMACASCNVVELGAPQTPPSTLAKYAPPEGHVVSRRAVDVDGAREYVVSAPSSSGKLPVVLVFHGGGMSAEGMRAYADLESRARSPAIYVYPSARVRNVWASEYALHWDGEKDLPFVDAILKDLAHAFPIDASRVYAIGLSSGAYFANELGCARAKTLAGIVAIEGGGPFGNCEGAVSAMIVHDLQDPNVPVSEGEASLKHWLTADACPSDRESPGKSGFVSTPENICNIHVCGGNKHVLACEAKGGIHAIADGVREAALTFMQLR